MRGPILGSQSFLRYSSNINIVFDGNSLVQATQVPSGDGIAEKTATLAPLSSLVVVKNIGVNGQTINDMRNRGSAYADANFVAGKKNMLIAWEGTNAIFNSGATGAVAGAQMEQYCVERLAAHPDWIIVLMTTLPRFSTGSFSIVDGNAQLDAYNAYLQANFKRMGARKVVDVRASGVFAYTGPTMSAAMSPLMNDTIHYNSAGGALLSQYLADGLKRVPLR